MYPFLILIIIFVLLGFFKLGRPRFFAKKIEYFANVKLYPGGLRPYNPSFIVYDVMGLSIFAK